MRDGKWIGRAALLLLLAAGGCDRANGVALGEGGGGASSTGARARRGGPAGGGEAASGEELYARFCAACHGAEGGGTQLGPSLADAEWTTGRALTEDEIGRVIRQGVPEPRGGFPIPMPPAPLLTDDEVRALAAHTHGLGR